MDLPVCLKTAAVAAQLCAHLQHAPDCQVSRPLLVFLSGLLLCPSTSTSSRGGAAHRAAHCQAPTAAQEGNLRRLPRSLPGERQVAQRPQLACVPQAEVLLAGDGQQGAIWADCYVLDGALCRQAVKAFNRAETATRKGHSV